MTRVIVTGESWHGSDVTGLAHGFMALGCAVDLLGTDRFFPANARSIPNRLVTRALAPWCRANFNQAIVRSVDQYRPDLVVVFKGTHVRPATLAHARAAGAWLCNFYPDVTLHGHRGLDIRIFPLFDHIFTTKSFGVDDYRSSLGLEAVTFVPHGFDPLVHRPLADAAAPHEACDVSFIGTWSPNKENLLDGLLASRPELKLRIWGNQWERAVSEQVRRAVAGHPVTGDFYALAIGASRINLGLLSEVREGASSGDRVTSRTFHIPAAGGFMLHERTEEVREYFTEDEEIGCFEGVRELIEKVDYYLANEQARLAVASAGHRRCVAENSMATRASVILEVYERRANRSREQHMERTHG